MERELSQPDKSYNDAGEHAYMLCVPLSNNPYKTKPSKDLWERGWKTARRLFEPEKPWQRKRK